MFDSKLISRAEVLYYRVFNDGNMVRIYRTPQCYRNNNVKIFYNDEELNSFVEKEIDDYMNAYEKINGGI